MNVKKKSEELLSARDDATVLGLCLIEQLAQHPILALNRVVELRECSRPAAARALRVLEGAEVVSALDEGEKPRAPVLRDSPAPLREGTELMCRARHDRVRATACIALRSKSRIDAA